jgi:hypothetical protein
MGDELLPIGRQRRRHSTSDVLRLSIGRSLIRIMSEATATSCASLECSREQGVAIGFDVMTLSSQSSCRHRTVVDDGIGLTRATGRRDLTPS